MRTTLVLDEQARKRLEETFRSTPDPWLRDRCQAMLMVARGRPRRVILQDLQIGDRTLSTWLSLYRRRGLEGLRITWPPGREPLLKDEHALLLIKWVKQGPAACGLNRANWTFDLLADYFAIQTDIRVSETTMRDFGHKHGIYPYRPTYRFLRGDPVLQAEKVLELAELKKKAELGECSLLSQDEGRFQLVPTLSTTLGVKGFRPEVGSWDSKDVVQFFGSINLVTGELVPKLYGSTAQERRKDESSKTKRMQQAFAEHLEDLAKAYPIETNPTVWVMIDGAPWHRGKVIDGVLEKHPHLHLFKLPAYSPKLNPIERFWKALRQRATHNRLFETLEMLVAALQSQIAFYVTHPEALLVRIGHPAASFEL